MNKNDKALFGAVVGSNMDQEDKYAACMLIMSKGITEVVEKEIEVKSEEYYTDKEITAVRYQWSHQQRLDLFGLVVDSFGPVSKWKGRKVPSNHTYRAFCDTMAAKYGRTRGAIFSQIREAIIPLDEVRQRSLALVRIKEAAKQTGLV